MKTLFVAVSLAISFSSFSQSHFITEKGGITISNVAGKSILGDLDNYMRISAGLGYTFQTKTALSFGADLLYNQYGGKLEVTYFSFPIIPNDDDPKFIRYEYNYYSLPLKIGLSQGNKGFFYMNTGLIPSFQIRSLILFPEEYQGSNSVQQTKYDVTDNVNRFDLGALFEVGGGVKIGERFSVLGEVNVHYSITQFTNQNHFQDSKGNHYGMTAYLGLRYMLKTSTSD